MPRFRIPEGANVIKTHFGMGVPLSYTLSGFVLAFGHLDSLDGRARVRNFYIRRFFRIAPLFYVMLVVWVIHSWATIPRFGVGPFELFLNVTLLFGLVPGREGSLVPAGWSIGVEVLYYLLFPIIAALLTTPAAAGVAFCVFTVVSSMAFAKLESLGVGFYAYGNLLTHLPCFISGTLAFLVWRADAFRERPRLGAGLLGGAIVVALALVYVTPVYVFMQSFTVIKASSFCWTLVFASSILSVCYFPNRVLINRVTRYLGTRSYSIYLVHPLVITLTLRAQWHIDQALEHGWLALGCRLVFVFAAIVGVASLTYRFIESPGILRGKKLTAPRATAPAVMVPLTTSPSTAPTSFPDVADSDALLPRFPTPPK